MKENLNNTLSNTLSVITASWGISNIQDILGIIVLILSIMNILWNMIYKIYNNIKSKNYTEIDDNIKNAIDEINNINLNSKEK